MSASECTSDDNNCDHGVQATWVSGTTTASVFVGAVLGQLSMGFLGDYLGRNIALMITLSIATLFSLLTALAPQGTARSVYLTLIILRFFVGIGLGGLYPLCAIKASEDASDGEHKPDVIASSMSFFWQLPGVLFPWILAYCLSQDDDTSTGEKWRLMLGIGAIFPFLAIIGAAVEMVYYKDVKETHYRNDKIDLRKAFEDKRNIRYLVIAGGSWFIYDVVVYGVALFGGEILYGIANTDDNISSMKNIALISQEQIIAIIVGFPATLSAIVLLSKYGMRKLQIYSFALMALMLFILAILFQPLHGKSPKALFALYCFMNMSLQSGVNITTYSLSARLFNKDVRSTFNGFASALGKFGAAVGAASFEAIAVSSSYAVVLGLSCVISVIGMLFTMHLLEEEMLAETNNNKSLQIIEMSDNSLLAAAAADKESQHSN